MSMKMMISALLVTFAITLSSSQTLTNDDITRICDAVRTQGQCTSCNWCSVRNDGFPLKVKELCRVRNSPSDCSQALSDFPCSNITNFYSQSCPAGSWVHTIVCPIAESASSCFVTTEASTTTVTTTTVTTTTVLTTTTTTMPSLPGPDVALKSFMTDCTQRCVRNDIVASECGSSTLTEACNNLDDPALNGQYTCCTG